MFNVCKKSGSELVLFGSLAHGFVDNGDLDLAIVSSDDQMTNVDEHEIMSKIGGLYGIRGAHVWVDTIENWKLRAMDPLIIKKPRSAYEFYTRSMGMSVILWGKRLGIQPKNFLQKLKQDLVKAAVGFPHGLAILAYQTKSTYDHIMVKKARHHGNL